MAPFFVHNPNRSWLQTEALPSHRRRVGLTLVELLASLTLSALLMGAVLGVLTSITRSQKVVLQRNSVPARWQAQLDELLAWDLENSRMLQFTETGIRLIGFAGRDFSTRMPIHCPCTVDYEIVTVEKQAHLIRRETHLELLSLDNSLTELVCPDISGLVLGPPNVSGSALVDANFQEKLTDGPLPSRLSLMLIGGHPATPIYSRNFTRK